MARNNPGFKLNHWVVIVLFVCIVTRLLFFAFEHPWNPHTEKDAILIKDALGYHDLAITLIEHNRFAWSDADEPNTVRTPLYPVFIAGVYSLFGYKPWVVLLFQILISTLTCLVFIVTLTRLFNQQVALIAAFFYATDPHMILYTATLLSDVVFVTLLVITLYWFSLALTTESTRKALAYYGLSGLFIGLSTLVRPIAQYVPFVFVIFFILWFRRKPIEIIKYSTAVLIVFLIGISPWLIRNYQIFGRVAISSAGSHNLLIEYVVPMEIQNRRQDIVTVQNSLLAEADGLMRADGFEPEKLNGFERSDYYKQVAIKYIKGDLIHFGQTYIMGIFHTFAELDTSIITHKLGIKMNKIDVKSHANIIGLVRDFIATKGAAGLLIAGLVLPYMIVTYLGLTIGFFVSWSRYHKGALLLCLGMAMYFVLVSGVGGSARFKIPAIPFYLPFTGIGIYYLYDIMKHGRTTKRRIT